MLHGWRSSPILCPCGSWWVSSVRCSGGSCTAVAVAWMCCDERITDIAFKALILRQIAAKVVS